MENVSSWVNVVTDPLGLAGFALFLIFGLVAKVGSSKGQQWVAMAAVLMAVIALIGGMLLSLQSNKAVQQPVSVTSPVSQPESGEASQTTHGEQSPAVQNVDGSVTINIGSQGENKE